MKYRTEKNNDPKTALEYPWQVVSVPANPVERQLFPTREEARAFARIRRSATSFNAAVTEYSGCVELPKAEAPLANCPKFSGPLTAPESTTFRVVSTSSHPDSFGQWGHILIDRQGNAFEVARQRGEWMKTSWARQTDVGVPHRFDGSLDWFSAGVELQPRALPKAPEDVIAQVWRELDAIGRVVKKA